MPRGPVQSDSCDTNPCGKDGLVSKRSATSTAEEQCSCAEYRVLVTLGSPCQHSFGLQSGRRAGCYLSLETGCRSLRQELWEVGWHIALQTQNNATVVGTASGIRRSVSRPPVRTSNDRSHKLVGDSKTSRHSSRRSPERRVTPWRRLKNTSNPPSSNVTCLESVILSGLCSRPCCQRQASLHLGAVVCPILTPPKHCPFKQVMDTTANIKGNTASGGGSKPATMETGAVVQVRISPP